MIDGERGLPRGRQLQFRVDEVDVATQARRRTHARLVVRIRAEGDALGGRAVLDDRALRDVVVRERVRQPDVGRDALEQTDTATDLRLTLEVRAPVEREARLDQLVAIDRRIVGQTKEIRGECVEGRTIINHRRVHAHTSGQGQLGADHPGVLQEEAQVLELPSSGTRVHITVGRVEQVVGARRARAERVDTVELIDTELVTTEEVEDVLALVVDAELGGVIAPRVGAGREEGLRIDLHDVDVTEALRTDPEAVGARAVRAVQADLDGRQRRADVVIRSLLRRRERHFRRERRRPVAVQLCDRAFELTDVVVPVARERERARTEVRQDRQNLLGFVQAQARTVRLVDVPVELHEDVFDLGVEARGRVECARVELPHVLGDRGHFGDLRLRDAGHDVRSARARRAEARGLRVTLELLVAREEEQLVFDDRATQGRTDGVLVLEARELVASALSDPVVAARDVVSRALKLVRTRLGDGVDARARVTRASNVEVSKGDVDRLDRVDADRLTLRRQVVRLETEAVVGRHTVDADIVEAGVLTARRDFATLLVGLRDARIGADVVLDVAVDRRQAFDLFARDARARARAGRVEHRVSDAVGRDHDFGKTIRLHVDDDTARVTELQELIVERGALVTGTAHRDRVRTADANAAEVETTIGIGRRAAHRSRGNVTQFDGETADRIAVSRNDFTGGGC